MLRYILLAFLVANCAIGQAATETQSDDVRSHILQLERAWERALSNNDASRLDELMASDWRMISADSKVVTKEQALSVLRSGMLKYDSVTFDDVDVRVYTGTAVVMARSREKGNLRGQAFDERYIFTDVFVMRGGAWRSVLTQVTHIPH